MSDSISLVLVIRQGCHLCVPAIESTKHIAAVFQDEHPEIDVHVRIQDIADQVDFQRFTEEVPVLLVNDKQVSFWRIDEERVLEHLRELV